MFAELTKKLVNNAINSETAQAMKNYGETYNSLHEGYAVLKEEVEEAGEAWESAERKLNILWEFIRTPEVFMSDKPTEIIFDLKSEAEKIALEAVQVAAVCNKILNGI